MRARPADTLAARCARARPGRPRPSVVRQNGARL